MRFMDEKLKLRHITHLITNNINDNMLLLLFTTITFASNFLFLTQSKLEKSTQSKLEKFNSNTFTTTTISNITTGPLASCTFNNTYNIYFTSLIYNSSSPLKGEWGGVNNSSLNIYFNKYHIATKEILSIEKNIATYIINGNNIFTVNTILHHYQLSQLIWPDLIPQLIFNSKINWIQSASLFIPPSSYLFDIDIYDHQITQSDILINITNTSGFKVSQIYPIKHQILSIYYYNNTIFVLIYKNAIIRLCSILHHELNCVIKYNDTMSYQISAISNNILHMITTSHYDNNKYWIETNMLNLTYTTQILPLTTQVICMQPL